MSSKSSAEACFSIPEIIQRIAVFVDNWDKCTLSYFSRTNRCTHISLQQERNRTISCRVENIPSLSMFIDRRLSQDELVPCRSLEIIGNRGFQSDPRDVDAHSSLVSILNHLGENRRLDAFSYRGPDQSQEFVCVPPQIWTALRPSSGALKSLNIMTHSCNWDTLFAIDFSELRGLQLAIDFSILSPYGCRNVNLSYTGTLLSSQIPRFLQCMQHLTNLMLSLPYARAGTLNMKDLLFPALLAVDLSSHTPPLGLTRFIARHPELLRLQLRFEASFILAQVQVQDLPNLRALKFRAGSVEHAILSTFFARRPPAPSNAEEVRARRLHIEHISICNLQEFRGLEYYISPYGSQLRRLDLQISNHRQISQNHLSFELRSFTALVELSITIIDIHPELGLVKRTEEKSISELRNYLKALKRCVSLKALHLHNPPSRPVSSSNLQNLEPLPPSLQYISWKNRSVKTTFRIVRDSASHSPHAVVCEVPSVQREIVYDWTSENTFRHAFDL
ncbi:hypothetical protein SCHPADRAFT_931094 [Schizopora paradoxa]|uniref:F-box domain-containing protein n=1 Tax=Schizopora paradoxa TaxID=27342 RepID=A0A0H2RDC4_9AGAM|nr:hypothetical protein SCHPADRAFT_931094 [Schizopora paradoxa]